MQRRSYWTKIRSGIAVAALCLGLTAVAEAAPFGYITDLYNGQVTIIDLALNENHAIDAVAVGGGPIGVAVTPDGSLVYVANSTSDNVTVIDAYGVFVDTIDLGTGSQPQGIAISPDGKKAYVAHYGTDGTYLSEINTDTQNVTNNIRTSLDLTLQPFAVITNPLGTRIYISNTLGDSVSIVDATTFTLSGEVEVLGDPKGMAITPNGEYLLVANKTGNSVARVNTANPTFVEYLDLGPSSSPWAVAIHPGGHTAYVTGSGNNSVFVINLQNNDKMEILDTVPVGITPQGITVNNDGTFVYVANKGREGMTTVSVINTETLFVTTIDLFGFDGATPGGQIDIALGPVLTGKLSVESSLTFDDLKVGLSPITKTVTVTNSGPADLTLGTIGGLTGSTFSISADGVDDCKDNQILAFKDSCTIQVTFDPETPEYIRDTFVVSSDFGNTTVSVTGRGLDPNDNLPPSAPELVDPKVGQIDVSTTPTFRWIKVTDADGDPVKYELYCSNTTKELWNTDPVAYIDESGKMLPAGLGAGALLALFGIGAARNRQSRKKLALLASLLILAGALVSACGGGGSSPTSSPTGNQVAVLLTEDLTPGEYHWMVVADDGEPGGRTESAVRSFTVK